MPAIDRAPIDTNHHKGLIAADEVTGDPFAVQGVASDGSINVNATITPVALQDVNLTDVGGTDITLGQKTMAASLPVVIASDQSTLAVSGTVTVTGVSTAANQTNGSQLTQIVDAGGDAATVTGGRLDVNATVSGGVGASAIDDVAFAVGVDSGTPAMGLFDDVAPDSVNEGDVGVLRMSANRNGYMTIRDAAGNERGVNVTAGNALIVDASATTQPISGTVTASDVTGNVASGSADSGNPVKVGGRYNSTRPTLSDGQRGDIQLGTRGSLGATLYVADSVTPIAAVVTNVDSVTESSIASHLQTASLGYAYDGAAWDRMRGDSTDGLLVNLGANNDVSVSNGAGASAVNIQDGGNTITVDGTVTLGAGSAVIGAITNLIPGTGNTNLGAAVDAASGGTKVGVLAIGIRDDALATLTPVDGDYTEGLRVDSTGAHWVHVTSIDAALPAGTNGIGKLTANSGVDIGDVDVTSAITGTLDHGSNRDIDATAEQITSTSFACKFGVTLRADANNTGVLYVGNSDVTAGTTDATDGMPLYAGDSLFLPVSNSNIPYAIGSAANQVIYWAAA